MLKNKRKKKKQLNAYIKYSSLTIQMAALISIGAYFGDYLDKENSSETPNYTITFSLISFFLALYYVFKK